MGKISIIKIIRRPFRPLKSFYYKQKERNQFKRLLRPSDVFLVGYPKSGNTWLTYMLGVLIQNNFSKNITMANMSDFIPTVHSQDNKIALYVDFPNPRIFRNEGPIYPELYPKTIYIMRDPRAVYVSYFHHYVHCYGNHSIEEFVDELLTYGCIRKFEPFIVRWDRQVLQWHDIMKRQPVKIVKYEDLKKDSRKVLKEVAEFAGITCSEKDIDMAVERGSFESMRKDEKTFGAEAYGTKGGRGYFVRRGKIDGWKDELPYEISERIKNEFSETMEKVGYL